MERFNVILTFLEPILGTVAKDPEVYASFIAKNAPVPEAGAQEVETVPESLEHKEAKGWTGFHELEGEGGPLPSLYDYVLKGFFKDACGMLRRVEGTLSKKTKAYKKIIDGLVFVEPRQIALILPEGAEMGVLERPLRAQTAQGERIALARSDTCPAGTMMFFTVELVGAVTETLLMEWLDYGSKRGLGQWRNAGYGRFEYEIEKVEEKTA